MAEEKAHILVVEDDASLAQWISDYLIEHGFEVSVANQGDTALELIKSDSPDLVVLDVMLPVMSGLKVCATAREFFYNPILMLTACADETDEILGLEFGADDYLTKPVRPRVLLARIHALLRRGQDTEQLQRTYGGFFIDAKSREVTVNGELLALSDNEFDILWQLASQPGEILSRDDLLNELRGLDYDGLDRSIDLRISRLRKKLNDGTSPPQKIKTIRGKGYLFSSNAWGV
ncbi:MAG: response regulator [Halioglobus sp.]